MRLDYASVRHLLKAGVFVVLPKAVQESIDRRYYERRLARGDLSREAEFDLLPTLVDQGSVACDVGANLGGYALRLSQLVGASGSVHAFEPVPRTVRLLRHNVRRLAAHDNVTIHEAAVSDADGTAILHLPLEGALENFYTAALRRRGDERTRPMPVRTVALDTWSAGMPRVSFIKVDTEGAEWNVLSGARRLLHEHRPALLCEVGDGVRLFGHEQEDVFALISDLGYRPFRYVEGRLRPVVGGPDRLPIPNYVFLPSNDLGRVEHLLA